MSENVPVVRVLARSIPSVTLPPEPDTSMGVPVVDERVKLTEASPGAGVKVVTA
jgi:hypothetical protein